MLKLKNPERFDPFLGGYAGIAGDLEQPVALEDFIAKVKALFNIDQINYLKYNKIVKRIGIVAGGGSEISSIQGALDKGCDTYLTGEYINRINNEYGQQSRDRLNKFLMTLSDMNLIECSHYATEAIVLKNAFQLSSMSAPANVASSSVHMSASR